MLDANQNYLKIVWDDKFCKFLLLRKLHVVKIALDANLNLSQF